MWRPCPSGCRGNHRSLDPSWCSKLEGSSAALASVTEHLAGLALAGDPHRMLLHAADYMDLCSTVVIGWMWLLQAAAATEGLAAQPSEPGRAFYEGELCAAQYWVAAELGRVGHLAALCRAGDDSYGRMLPGWFLRLR